MLIIFGGLPGVGKTTIARALARRLKAVHLRIDTIEQAIKNTRSFSGDMKDLGYKIAYQLAKDNLLIGNSVVADSVNSVQITRDAWRDVAASIEKPFIEIEVICSDLQAHKKRTEERVSDIENFTLPTWEKVCKREYHAWSLQGIQLDTAKNDVEHCVEKIITYLSSHNGIVPPCAILP